MWRVFSVFVRVLFQVSGILNLLLFLLMFGPNHDMERVVGDDAAGVSMPITKSSSSYARAHVCKEKHLTPLAPYPTTAFSPATHSSLHLQLPPAFSFMVAPTVAQVWSHGVLGELQGMFLEPLQRAVNEQAALLQRYWAWRLQRMARAVPQCKRRV